MDYILKRQLYLKNIFQLEPINNIKFKSISIVAIIPEDPYETLIAQIFFASKFVNLNGIEPKHLKRL